MESKNQSLGKIQKIDEGYGAAYHRVYTVTLNVPFDRAREVMKEMMADPNKFSPQLLAKFEKTKGDLEKLHPRDEFQIHLPGPWNGPVRVSKVSDCEFHLVTLEGHLEAGEINFKISKAGKDQVIFEIESLARSRDGLVDLVYDKIPLVKLAQTEMWTMFCESFAEKACGCDQPNLASEVHVLTERFDKETGTWQKL